jgi:hypothetical protein
MPDARYPKELVRNWFSWKVNKRSAIIIWIASPVAKIDSTILRLAYGRKNAAKKISQLMLGQNTKLSAIDRK